MSQLFKSPRFFRALLLVLPLGFAFTIEAQGREVAKLYSKEGVVHGVLAPNRDWKEVEIGAAFKAGDQVRVAQYGRAGIMFSDGVLLRLGSGAFLQFQDKDSRAHQPVFLRAGLLHFFSREPREAPWVTTPHVSAAVRGTEFVVRVEETTTTITVIDGLVDAANEFGAVSVGQGEEATAVMGAAPVKRLVLNPYDAVQWALSYPPVLDLDDYADFPSGAPNRLLHGWRALKERDLKTARDHFRGNSWRDVMGRSLVMLYEKGPAAAVQIIEEYRGVPGSGFLLYHSSLLLALGEGRKAEDLLSQAEGKLSAAPPAARVRLQAAIGAARAIVSLIRNRKDQAAKEASRAMALSPLSSSSLLAASYVAQSAFDLEQARVILERARINNERNGFLYARLAEVDLAFHDLRQAEARADRAFTLDSTSAFAWSMKGFISLFKNDRAAAEKFFDQALAFDSSAAPAHFGKGLTLIKRGDLPSGRKEIEKAIQLEPTVAIYRSYLGKAFFEEGREDDAFKEYGLAMQLDPKDPTPFLYRSFAELSVNRPVAALTDVERSIALNDNRAVFRSSYLLDRDLGARSAGLGKIFNDLGFSEAGRVEAIKAINYDYLNYSAHRMLGDTNILLENDLRQTELHLADILAPLSFNKFYSLGGASSLNDYDALFDRAEQRSGFDLNYDSQVNDYAARAFQAGRNERTGYYLELAEELANDPDLQLHQYRVRAAVQYQYSYWDQTLLDARSSYFDEEGPDDFEDQAVTPFNIDLAHTHRFDAHSLILFDLNVNRLRVERHQLMVDRDSVIEEYYDDGSDLENNGLDTFDKTRQTLQGTRGTAQFITAADSYSAVAGLQYYHQELGRSEASPILSDSAGIFTGTGYLTRSASNNPLNAADLYFYYTRHLGSAADLTLGMTETFVEVEDQVTPPYTDSTTSDSRWNPKAGMVLYPTEALTISGAYFETLRASSFEDQGALEPALVGGITQVYRDSAGVTARNAGVAADYKVSASSYLGGRYVHRALAAPMVDALDIYGLDENEQLAHDVFVDQSGYFYPQQDHAKGYYYQVLSPRWVGVFDYQYGREAAADILSAPGYVTEINKFSYSLKYFQPGGFFMFGRTTWRQQHFLDVYGYTTAESEATGISQDQAKWLFDAGVGYRLPKRRGGVVLQVLNIGNRHFQWEDTAGFEISPPKETAVVLSANFSF